MDCPVCKFPVAIHDEDGHRSVYCSEFCDQASAEERKKFVALQSGEFGLWPCPDCGVAIEDVYRPLSCCGPCGALRRRADQAFLAVKMTIEQRAFALDPSPLKVALESLLPDIDWLRNKKPRELQAMLDEAKS